MHSGFLDALDHLQNHLASVDDTEMTTTKTLTSQDHLKEASFQIRSDSDVYFYRYRFTCIWLHNN